MKKLTTEEFIKEAKLVHGDKFDYSLVDYKGGREHVSIICSVHGEFIQRASAHIGKQKQGCKKCAGEDRRLGLDEFLKRAIQIHGDKYDYSLITEYKPNRKHMTVICKNHGQFNVSTDHHINRGQGCPKCKSLNLDGFIEKANRVHGNRYNYSKSVYTNNKGKVDIICSKHGLFNQRVSDHINGQYGCPECGMEEIRLSTDEFIIKANEKHKNKYSYNKHEINFKSNKEKILITCPKHGDFTQRVDQHLQGNGCPCCRESKGEEKIRNYLLKNNINFIPQKRFNECRDILTLPFDFYLSDFNACIEFNGQQHYKPISYWGGEEKYKTQIKRDKIKMEYCRDNNIPLIVIKYDENVIEKLDDLFNRVTIVT